MEDAQLEEITEKYENLYINQWEVAFDIAREHFPGQDKEAIVKLLMQILQKVNQLCKKECEKQDKELMQAFCRTEKPRKDFPPKVKKILQTLKMSAASEGTDSLTEKFINNFDKSTDTGRFIHEVEEYVHECVSVCWSMALNSPQLDLYSHVRRFQAFNKHLFKPFVVYGEKVDHIVWPALVLDTNSGQCIIVKGVIKCLKMKARYESKTATVRSAVKGEDNREMSKSAKVGSTRSSAKMPEVSLRVKNITLHEPKRYQAKRHLFVHDKSTSRRTSDRASDEQQKPEQYVPKILHQVFETTPTHSALRDRNVVNCSSTRTLNNIRTNQLTDEAEQSCRLPHIRTSAKQPF